MIVIYLIILSRFSFVKSGLRACVPNSQFLVAGKICNCNNLGQWNETDCLAIGRKNNCHTGEIIWQGCKQCVCQLNGQFNCTRHNCTDENSSAVKAVQRLRTVMPWCNPFRSYYINCNICVCPPSGRAAEAHCATDISCSLHKEPRVSDLSASRNICIPKVMYLFPCLHCLCTDEGYFVLEKCFETCIARPYTESSRKCIPKTFYRHDCNVCKCPDNTTPDDTFCTKSVCNQTTVLSNLSDLKSTSQQCLPHRFTKPKCYYCECSAEGTINETACLELDCFKINEYKYDVAKDTCIPGEIVPKCTECLCLRNGVTSDDYCSSTCSYQSKLNVLEKIVDVEKDQDIIDKKIITRSSGDDLCEPNAIYIDLGRYCLCPENGNTNFNLCTPADDSVISGTTAASVKINIDFNMTCEPNTFIDFDCNTCFCSKKGKIDPKWCTYDDCESKKMIMKSHETQNIVAPDMGMNDTCISGSISQVDCNFCICPESGYMEKKVCTKNDCSSLGKTINSDRFVCEPLAYYEVDCNICYCPRDGLKNVARCTKNHCEKSFLRSDVCVPGQLFSEECNVCVCPPNGNKAERACTNNTCADSAPWKKIFQLSESLISNQIPEDATRNLDLCFPGEEFQIGCKLCSCPDMGLRSYATCSSMLCDDDDDKKQTKVPLPQAAPVLLSPPLSPPALPFPPPTLDKHNRKSEMNSTDFADSGSMEGQNITMTRRKELCVTYNVPKSEKNCSPGSSYIILISNSRSFILDGELQTLHVVNIGRITNNAPLAELARCVNATLLVRQQNSTSCMTYMATPVSSDTNISHTDVCQECICPYMGDLSMFCRPLPRDFYCEQPFGNQYYLPSSRRVKDNLTTKVATIPEGSTPIPKIVIPKDFQHDHTIYKCTKPGTLLDKCFMCECEDSGSVIEEHCFKSNDDNCKDVKPTFLNSTLV